MDTCVGVRLDMSRMSQNLTNVNLAIQVATNAPALESPNAPTVVMKSPNLAGRKNGPCAIAGTAIIGHSWEISASDVTRLVGSAQDLPETSAFTANHLWF